jgi:uncharacterized protein (TIGR02466 family)
MEAFAYFPSLIYREEHPEWVDRVSEVTKKYYDAAQNGSAMAQTMHMARDPDLRFLVDYLLWAGDAILRDQGYDMGKYDLYLSGLWGQEVKCAAGTNVHVHKNSQLCGWFFLETPEGGAYPIYYDPRTNKQMIELDPIPGSNITNASSSVYFNNVKPGTFLFANSWMHHQLTSNTSKSETKSVHFIISHRERECNIC